MIQLTNYTISDTYTNFAKILLESAFPPDERPSFETLKNRTDKEFHFNVIENDGKLVGILSFWEFEKFVYIEHFAIDKALRNNRLGSQVLSFFTEQKFPNKEIIFEVELPENQTAKQRITFYERNGFFCHTDFNYQQPPYEQGLDFVSMLIMSRNELQISQLQEFTKTLYQKVYHADYV